MNPQTSKPVLYCALGLLAAFFMPWAQLGPIGISGYQLGQLGDYGAYAWSVPVLAGITSLVSFTGGNNRGMGIATGVVPLCILAYGFLRISGQGGGDVGQGLFQIATNVLAVGFYATLLLCIAIIVMGINPARGSATVATESEQSSWPPSP